MDNWYYFSILHGFTQVVRHWNPAGCGQTPDIYVFLSVAWHFCEHCCCIVCQFVMAIAGLTAYLQLAVSRKVR